jgi:hypothetical protein
MTVPGPSWFPGSIRKPAHSAEASVTEQHPGVLPDGVTVNLLPLGVGFFSKLPISCAKTPYMGIREPGTEWLTTLKRCLT